MQPLELYVFKFTVSSFFSDAFDLVILSREHLFIFRLFFFVVMLLLFYLFIFTLIFIFVLLFNLYVLGYVGVLVFLPFLAFLPLLDFTGTYYGYASGPNEVQQ